MDEELLFTMLEDAVAQAADILTDKGSFTPFALALLLEDKVIIVDSQNEDAEKAYAEIWEDLKAKSDAYKGVVIVHEVENPDSFSLSEAKSIRVHVENAHNKYDKVAARYLYIPYRLFINDAGVSEVALHQPKPISFSHEIFV